jgi:hypothetical protein
MAIARPRYHGSHNPAAASKGAIILSGVCCNSITAGSLPSALKSQTLPAAGTARLKVGVEIRRTVAGADFSVPVFVRSQMI